MAPEPWPADELEAVDCCPLCGCAERITLHRDLTDRIFFCAPGRWHLYRCRGHIVEPLGRSGGAAH